MKYLFYFLFLCPCFVFTQDTISASLVEKKGLYIETFVGVDNFKNSFYTNENTFFRRANSKTKMYANVQFGNITSVDIFNPLKINLFYQDFNATVILDNRLAEIYKIDFNRLKDYKNVSHVSIGHDNTLWIYNQDNLQLELFDYKTNTTRAKTLPIAETVLDLKSNYNYCWLLTSTHLYCYNYFGNLIQKLPVEGYTELAISSNDVYLKKDNNLYWHKRNTSHFTEIPLPELLINQFSVVGESLYIYDGELLYQYQLNF